MTQEQVAGDNAVQIQAGRDTGRGATEAEGDRQYNASAVVALFAAVLLTVSVIALSINLALNGAA